MKFKTFLAAAAFAVMGMTSAQAGVVEYGFTTSNGGTGKFSYNDTATTVGNGPYDKGGVAYNALSFSYDGVQMVDPLLVIYQNYYGDQSAYFTDVIGDAYLQLAVIGTGVFTSSAASQMDGRTLSDFTWSSENIMSDGSLVTSLTSTSAVPEPSSLALMGLGLAAFVVVRRRTSR